MGFSIFDRITESKQANKLADLIGPRQVFRSAATVSSAREFSTDAAQLETLPQTRARDRGTEKALRTLSDGASYVSIAQNATESVQRLVDEAYAIATTLKGEVTPDQRESLSSYADSLLSEIDSIVSDAEFNDQAIADGGEVTFSVNLNAADESTSNTYNVSVLDVPLSQSSLGLSSLTASSFADSPTATLTTLANAQASLSQTATNLEASENQITAIANEFGKIKQSRFTSMLNDVGELDAEALAQKIANNISAAVGSSAENLNLLRVQDLLAPPETISSSTAQDEEDEDSSLLSSGNIEE